MSFHLTHVGPWAGRPLCSGTRTPNDQHPSYSAAGMARQLANCCTECARLWNEAAEPQHDCASIAGSHSSDCQLALARGTTRAEPGDFD